MIKHRDLSIDIFRTLGIFLIFLAHTNCPFIIRQIRIFDVILLIIVSGYVFKEPKNLYKYIFKRFERLVLPTWIFLIFFWGSIITIKKIFNIDLSRIEVFSPKSMLESFLLYKGIGFVWIFGVYFITSVIAPIILKKINFFKIIVYYLFAELTLQILLHFNIEMITIFNFVMYSLVFCYGKLLKDGRIPLKLTNGVLLILICSWLLKTKNYDISLYKYPPNGVYVWYSLLICNILFYFKLKIEKKLYNLRKVYTYIGSSTMWFYLFHIIVYYMLLILKKVIILSWIEEYFLLIFLSLVLLRLKDLILGYLVKKKNIKQKYIKLFQG